MPALYYVDTENRIIFWDFEGAVTDAELLAAVQKLWADPQYRPEYSRLVDTTQSNSTRLSAEVVRWIAYRNGRPGVGKFAFVVGSDPMFGMARMYEMYSEGAPCQVFRSRSAALAWLAEDKGAGAAASTAGQGSAH